jgi:hypothetical protein
VLQVDTFTADVEVGEVKGGKQVDTFTAERYSIPDKAA